MKLFLPLVLASASFAAAQTIPEVATDDGRFTTLVAALEAADLVETLSGPGPFTVFAPLDDAFDALPEGLVTCLLKPENKEVLTDILTYHVIADQKVMAADVTDGMTATAVNGDDLDFDVEDDGSVEVEDVPVVVADVGASNGVIHAIGSVLVPDDIDAAAFLASDACSDTPTDTTPTMTPASKTIPEVATDDGRFTTLVAALEAADLVETLSGPGPFTVFAPLDDAFDALPDGLVTCLLKPENKEVLTDILTYHVISGQKVMAADVTDGMTATALNGDDLDFDVEADGSVEVEDVPVVVADVGASNGVIHAIGSVLVPDDIDAAAFLASDACSTDGAPSTPSTTPPTNPSTDGGTTMPPTNPPTTSGSSSTSKLTTLAAICSAVVYYCIL